MRTHAVGLGFGVAIGVVMAWARLSDPVVIRDMLLLREYDVFLLMGSAVFVAGVGVRMLRRTGVRALATGEEISWTTERPQARHFAGAALFGAGWSLAGTCPGPVAAMIGEGRVAGLVVGVGIAAGVLAQAALAKARDRARTTEVAGTAGL